MEFLTSWITNIILFVFLAIIIDLLLPNSSIQKYAKMVISLLLIVIILNPIMKIFDSNIEEKLTNIIFPTTFEKKLEENLIENKKKEIQALQRAYILEQMAVQMKAVVEDELMNRYGFELAQVNLQFQEDITTISEEHLQAVNVVIKDLEQTSEYESVATIKEVIIDTSLPIYENDGNHQLNDVQAFLAEKWQLEKDKVVVFMEGGKM